MADPGPAPLSGRRAQAARNDTVILEAACRVFVANPTAAVAEVAAAAGVGLSALYRRYPSKEDLLRALCADGLARFVAIAQAALDLGDQPWAGLVWFLEGVMDADVHSLTVHLAGSFVPTAEMEQLAERAGQLAGRLVRHAHQAGVLRADWQPGDLPMLLEQLCAIRLGGPDRTRELRRRYLAMHLDAMRVDSGRAGGEAPARHRSAAAARLPGSPPSAEELGQRWETAQRG